MLYKAITLATLMAVASAGPQYLGCYKDSGRRDIGKRYSSSSRMTVSKCASICKGYKYFGVQYSSQCFCDNSYGRYGRAGGCTRSCSGNRSQKCGGSWRNSVYRTESSCPLRDDVHREMNELKASNARELNNAVKARNAATAYLNARRKDEENAGKRYESAIIHRKKKVSELNKCRGQKAAVIAELNTLTKTAKTETKLLRSLKKAVTSFMGTHGKRPTKAQLNLNKAKLRKNLQIELEEALEGNDPRYNTAQGIISLIDRLIRKINNEVGHWTHKRNTKTAECNHRTKVRNAALANEASKLAALKRATAARKVAETRLQRARSYLAKVRATQAHQNKSMSIAAKAVGKLSCHKGSFNKSKNVCNAFTIVDEAITQKIAVIKAQRSDRDHKRKNMLNAAAHKARKVSIERAALNHRTHMRNNENTCYAERKAEQKELAGLKARTYKLVNMVKILKRRTDCVIAVKRGGAMPKGCEAFANIEEDSDLQEMLEVMRNHSELRSIHKLLDTIVASLMAEYKAFAAKVSKITCSHRISARKDAENKHAVAVARRVAAVNELRRRTGIYVAAHKVLMNNHAVYDREYKEMKTVRAHLIVVAKHEKCRNKFTTMAALKSYRP